MAMNPVSFTEKVVSDFLRYQTTTFAFSDPDLASQLRGLLSLEETRRSPLLKGPFISVSRSFRMGSPVSDLVGQGLLHPFMEALIPYSRLYSHQERAIRSIRSGKTTLISTGTGSGKTECFLYPIISRCLELRDQNAEAGIVAVLIYPMNALAEDQLNRLRVMLAGTGIPFGMYVGKTPHATESATGIRLPPGSSREAFLAEVDRVRRERRPISVYPSEERISREEMRTPGKQPRILLTNVKQLELLLTRHDDVELFDGARLEYLVCDEAHTYGGAAGAETACLIRRLRTFCGRGANETVCVGTSATLIGQGQDASPAYEFASRFFGVDRANVDLVQEEYEPDQWASERFMPPTLPGDPAVHLRTVLEAIEATDHAGQMVRAVVQAMTGRHIAIERWPESLYDLLSQNELCYQLSLSLQRPRELGELVRELSNNLGRTITEEEVLAWLALGTLATRDGRCLLRPVVHAFVRGVGGAVVTFPEGWNGPKLWLSAEDSTASGDGGLHRLEVTACTTCGQHYFVHYVKDLEVGPTGLGGGDAVPGGRRVWPALVRESGGSRVVLLDHLVDDSQDDDEEDPRHTQPVYFCRYCGALHPEEANSCDSCGRGGPLVRLLAVEQNPDHPGYLTSCLSCRAPGRARGDSYREPCRPVRAITVSDIHVLAQNMLQHAERKRLLVFADNRQEAAFQAGWMRDHARRFRLRALMMEGIEGGPISVGDLVAYLDDRLADDDELSRSLIPEVWRVHRKEAEGVKHGEERRYFLRILVLREITTGIKQRTGLEPWGRIKVEYSGLTAEHPFVRQWANKLNLEPRRLCDGISAILDVYRRGMHLYDQDTTVFTRVMREGDSEIQRGYMPILPGVPKGLTLRRGRDDDKNRLSQWLTSSGSTVVRQAARAWGVSPEESDHFIQELWRTLVEDLKILKPVVLMGSRHNPLPRCHGAYQIDVDRLRVLPNRGVWRCKKCRRTQIRPTPLDRCLRWRCDGTLEFQPEDPDNYDLVALEERFHMVRPAEHSAQVPAEERERIENLFKGEGDVLNTLVCTPTLELGVDIGSLDTVLMRNVPPLPSNYWQRAGRAGRRQRLAVNITYARSMDHDRAYFAEPSRLLEGRVEPPRFNMKNELMVAKHVHAAVMTCLYSLARPASPLSPAQRSEISEALLEAFPARVSTYLFDEAGQLRDAPYSCNRLRAVISAHRDALKGYVMRVFAHDWPPEDSEVVTEEALLHTIDEMAEKLDEVIATLRKRLDWALSQIQRLEQERRRKGTLEPDEDALYHRCDRLIKRLKGVEARARREAEGYDDTYTYGVLAAEGFLPGYGLEVGSVMATAIMPRHVGGAADFYLPRASAIAVREYVPGNLIYANGHRFVVRYFHLEPVRPILLQVDTQHNSVREVGVADPGAVSTLGASALKAVPICDVDLTHVSHISDEEEYRFQLQVTVYGHETGRHGPGKRYSWRDQELTLRRGVHLRLVNIGASAVVRSSRLGYPVSLISGQSRSPLASERELEEFSRDHVERYGRGIEHVGFFADIVADALCLPAVRGQSAAYSVLEALRTGMSQVLEMERDDLDILVVGHPGTDEVDALLYDPMPGGSGLLEQACRRWPEVVEAATSVVKGCPSKCEHSCVDCLQTFRNAFFHRHLDRKVALERLLAWGHSLKLLNDIPPRMPGAEPRRQEWPVNVAESRLKEMLERAGFPQPEWHRQIVLGGALGTTNPDCFFEGIDQDEPGVCVYLDGLSAQIHGNPETAERDRAIRTYLRNEGYEVIEIPASNLDDREAMAKVFFRLARILMGKDRAREIRDNPGWF